MRGACSCRQTTAGSSGRRSPCRRSSGSLRWRGTAPRYGGTTSERRWIGAICLVMVASQIYVSGSLNTWAGAGSFGQRRLVGLTIFLVIGLAALLHMCAPDGPASR